MNFSPDRTSLIIRAACVNDAEALQDLYMHLSSDNERCPTDLAERIIVDIGNYAGSVILVGVVDGKIVTTCTVIIVPNLTRGGTPYALIENVVTHPAYRQKGFGKSILDAASDRAWYNGCYKVMLSTGSQNPAILAFYAQAGFEQSRTGFQKRRIAPRPE